MTAVHSAGYWRKLDPPRPLRDWEREVLERLPSLPFVGREAVADQVHAARVSEESVGGPSVILSIPPDVPPILDRAGEPSCGVLPVELAGTDIDGMAIGVVLDLHAGYVGFLGVHRYDGETVKQLPSLSAFEIMFRGG